MMRGSDVGSKRLEFSQSDQNNMKMKNEKKSFQE